MISNLARKVLLLEKVELEEVGMVI